MRSLHISTSQQEVPVGEAVGLFNKFINMKSISHNSRIPKSLKLRYCLTLDVPELAWVLIFSVDKTTFDCSFACFPDVLLQSFIILRLLSWCLALAVHRLCFAVFGTDWVCVNYLNRFPIENIADWFCCVVVVET